MPSGTTATNLSASSISTQADEQGAKHTPGPWERDEIDRWRVNCSARGEMICATGLNGHHVEDAAANAQLIAASPDLLRACQDCLEGRGDWCARMYYAVRKAMEGIRD